MLKKQALRPIVSRLVDLDGLQPNTFSLPTNYATERTTALESSDPD
jgi:hypothetical protein